MLWMTYFAEGSPAADAVTAAGEAAARNAAEAKRRDIDACRAEEAALRASKEAPALADLCALSAGLPVAAGRGHGVGSPVPRDIRSAAELVYFLLRPPDPRLAIDNFVVRRLEHAARACLDYLAASDAASRSHVPPPTGFETLKSRAPYMEQRGIERTTWSSLTDWVDGLVQLRRSASPDARATGAARYDGAVEALQGDGQLWTPLTWADLAEPRWLGGGARAFAQERACWAVFLASAEQSGHLLACFAPQD